MDYLNLLNDILNNGVFCINKDVYEKHKELLNSESEAQEHMLKGYIYTPINKASEEISKANNFKNLKIVKDSDVNVPINLTTKPVSAQLNFEHDGCIKINTTDLSTIASIEFFPYLIPSEKDGKTVYSKMLIKYIEISSDLLPEAQLFNLPESSDHANNNTFILDLYKTFFITGNTFEIKFKDAKNQYITCLNYFNINFIRTEVLNSLEYTSMYENEYVTFKDENILHTFINELVDVSVKQITTKIKHELPSMIKEAYPDMMNAITEQINEKINDLEKTRPVVTLEEIKPAALIEETTRVIEEALPIITEQTVEEIKVYTPVEEVVPVKEEFSQGYSEQHNTIYYPFVIAKNNNIPNHIENPQKNRDFTICFNLDDERLCTKDKAVYSVISNRTNIKFNTSIFTNVYVTQNINIENLNDAYDYSNKDIVIETDFILTLKIINRDTILAIIS